MNEHQGNVKNSRYYCRECGYQFPKELVGRIQKGIQVFCENCGYPFLLDGVKFKEKDYKPKETRAIKEAKQLFPKKPKAPKISQKGMVSLNNAIQDLNKVSYAILYVVSILSLLRLIEFIWNWNLLNFLTILIQTIAFFYFGTRIAHFDKKYITPLIVEKNYNKVGISAFILGILGCIIFGAGALLLIKGILIIIYIANDEKNQEFRGYDSGLLIKDSLNSISSYAGVSIIILGLGAFTSRLTANILLGTSFINDLAKLGLLISTFVLLILSIAGISIDKKRSPEIATKKVFKESDCGSILVAGIIGCVFCAAGILILLKAIVMLALAQKGRPERIYYDPSRKLSITKETILEKPPIYKQEPIISPYEIKDEKQGKEQEIISIPLPVEKVPPLKRLPIEERREIDIKSLKKDRGLEEIPFFETVKKPSEIKSQKQLEKEFKKQKKIEEKIEKKFKKRPLKLRLHESLLPISEESDREIVEKYFLKIFNVLSEKIRRKILELNIPEKDKREILKEFAYLTEEEQEKYLNELFELNRKISDKLILRVKKLNLDPKYLQQIIEQLKYMPIDEQETYLKFLEEST